MTLSTSQATGWRIDPSRFLAGLVSGRIAIRLVVVLAAVGLSVSAAVGPAALAVGIAGLGVGVAYDLWLKGTPWSWLPFAVGIPLLPVYAWLGAMGGLPAAFVVVVPTAALAGSALALANALVDVERDRAAGVASPATILGRQATWVAGAALQATVVTVSLVSLPALAALPLGFHAAAPQDRLAPVWPWLALIALGALAMAAGLGLAKSGSVRFRQVGWEVQAAGLGLMAVGWLEALVGIGAL